MQKKPSSAAEQPAKFFAELKSCLGILRGIPVVAIEQLKNDPNCRTVLISVLRACYEICDDAQLDIVEEIEKQMLREEATDNLKELMRNDRLITLEELKKKGLKLAFGKDGPYVVPA